MDLSEVASGSETDEDFNDLNVSQNRKKKKSGGWQSMGKYF